MGFCNSLSGILPCFRDTLMISDFLAAILNPGCLLGALWGLNVFSMVDGLKWICWFPLRVPTWWMIHVSGNHGDEWLTVESLENKNNRKRGNTAIIWLGSLDPVQFIIKKLPTVAFNPVYPWLYDPASTVHLLLFLLAVRSGQNIYIRRLLNTCWRMKGVCRTVCKKNEIFHIFCGLHQLCCIDASSMPVLTGK